MDYEEIAEVRRNAHTESFGRFVDASHHNYASVTPVLHRGADHDGSSRHGVAGNVDHTSQMTSTPLQTAPDGPPLYSKVIRSRRSNAQCNV